MPPPGQASAAKVPARLVALIGAAAAVLLVVLVVLAVRKPSDVPEGGSAEPTAKNDVPKPAADPAGATFTETEKTKVQSALGKVTAGAVDDGLAELEKLAVSFPTEPAVLKALMQAYGKAKRPVDALATVKKFLAAQPDASADPALVPVFDDALANPAAVDVAFGLLKGPMKGDGGRILYALAYQGKPPQSLSAKAKEALADPDVQKALPVAIKGALELRSSPPGCGARKAVIEKYRDTFDTTALPLLKPLTHTKGCGGFFKTSDCWPCLREDNLLNKVIAGIEERAKKSGG
jgi:hypothetical protein